MTRTRSGTTKGGVVVEQVRPERQTLKSMNRKTSAHAANGKMVGKKHKNATVEEEKAAKKLKSVGSGRRAAQNHDFDESKMMSYIGRGERLTIVQEKKCRKERDVLQETHAGLPSVMTRRVNDFAVVDEKGNAEPLENLLYNKTKKMKLAGVVYPKEGPMNKETGRRVEGIGPITDFSVNIRGQSQATITIHTKMAEYIALRPMSTYKKCFENLSGQASIAFEVFKVVDPASGGNVDARFEEVLARLARTKVTREFSSPREGLLINGRFVLEQLKLASGKFSSKGGKKATRSVVDGDFYKMLEEEVSRYMYVGNQQQNQSNGIVIHDASETSISRASSGDPQEMADQQFAMQLQAKIDRELHSGRANATSARESQAYIKVSEEEIADDYPLPLQYVKEEEEMDEFILYDEELDHLCPEELPKRVLTDYAIYNADGLLTSLELLPMWSGIDPDVELYASGVVIEDGCGDCQVNASSTAAGSSNGAEEKPGMRMSLSQIREWVVELGPDMVFVSLRTDIGWYSLSHPSRKYKRWADVVLKCATVAAKTLQWICEESRASKLSYGDIVRRLAAEHSDSGCFISNKAPQVERFLSVHAQILLSCFQHFPSESVRRCAFIYSLKEKLNSLKHSKLYVSSTRSRMKSNRNPMKDKAAGTRSKPMTATATAMVKSVWQSYFHADTAENNAEGKGLAHEVEEDENEENDDEGTETALESGAEQSKKDSGCPMDLLVSKKIPKASRKDSSWVFFEELTTNTAKSSVKGFLKARVGKNLELEVGHCVKFDHEDADIGIIQAMWQNKNSSKKNIQVRVLKRGVETVLGDAASDEELFLTTESVTITPASIEGTLNVSRRKRDWNVNLRIQQFAEDAAVRQSNATVRTQGKGTMEMFWCKEYVPEEGMFRDAPNYLHLGTVLAQETQHDDESCNTATSSGIIIDGVKYKIGDFMYVHPELFDQMPEAQENFELPGYLSNARFHKGSHQGLRAWGIGRLLQARKGGKKVQPGEDIEQLVLQRFWRPEDISLALADETKSFFHIYAGEEEVEVLVEDIFGPVSVGPVVHQNAEDKFECIGTFDRKKKRIKPAPSELLLQISDNAHSGKGKKGKAAIHENNKPKVAKGTSADHLALATMDIFAGCGGLSEGFHQARAAITKWAIEYEKPAAESFKLNNPEAAVFCDNCNVLLHAAMKKAGQAEDCMASAEAITQSESLGEKEIQQLPVPGEVEFICGGPPCQGYSGMNRFNKGNWSMVQNSMVMAFLSYADFYRPRYFLLENVRNFVSHNKSFTFRLTLRSLLEMGYQVRFGVLNAGNFGVSQSRKRTFIWAAAPGEQLPAWPRLLHCFRTPQLTIKLPGNVQYTAVHQTEGAPLRPITVRDAISDLPPIGNGHDASLMKYNKEPRSAFQLSIRGDCDVLYDHVCKYMNELNMERCRCIPKNCPGADWRVLEEIVTKDPSRRLYKNQPLVPWCLPNTAERHNGWRGLFGRLDWRGHFPTSTTDPQPMGKVGQVFHPDQDRIVSVRECARAQGFPDRHRFVGSVQDKHRQVGNAVPPPLAAALGRQLRKALESKEKESTKKILAAQMSRLGA